MRSSCFILIALIGCTLSSARILFDDELRELTEFLRLQMHCGYPERGIPILAPAHLAYKEVDLQTDDFSCRGNFTDLTLVGLDGFEFRKLQWNNVLHTIKFDLNFPSIRLSSANYKLDILGQFLGADGILDLELIDFHAKGSFILRPSGIANGVHIVRWNVDWGLGKSISRTTFSGKSKMFTKFMNLIIDDFIDLTINDNPEEVAQFMEELIVPPMNSVLANVAWYEIAAIIMGLVEGLIPVEPIC
ncbi:uncharacterized protein LOC6562120 [Drosophila grimshawi]|uniref:GH11123 n=1 Tax=Drosophila grimshawi TaxID=7222 RepID=B4JCY7_DROGR|nr:uncharacterized protein LOC6562120 [Drosophila grimshawi]EDW03226.1 GH11123 [Drosophila grimshawi]